MCVPKSKTFLTCFITDGEKLIIIRFFLFLR
jgi:hypothetical protein